MKHDGASRAPGYPGVCSFLGCGGRRVLAPSPYGRRNAAENGASRSRGLAKLFCPLPRSLPASVCGRRKCAYAAETGIVKSGNRCSAAKKRIKIYWDGQTLVNSYKRRNFSTILPHQTTILKYRSAAELLLFPCRKTGKTGYEAKGMGLATKATAERDKQWRKQHRHEQEKRD